MSDEPQTFEYRDFRHLMLTIGELDKWLASMSSTEIERELRSMPARLVRALREHMPQTADPWRPLDMRNGEVVKAHRLGPDGGSIASVRRMGQGKRSIARWSAFASGELISPPPTDADGNAMWVDWPTIEGAKAACDEHLRELGVLLIDEEAKP